ncbi:MAG: hypothetical protein RLN74_12750, partial [Ilumatobacter fluminis]
IVGVYQDHNHDDRYYTEGEIDARLDARLPIASAFINGDGSLEGGFGIASSSYEVALGRYAISIEGVSYLFNDYVTLVTGVCNDRVVRTSSVSGNLLVQFEDLSGAPQTCSSGFAVQVYPMAD